MQNFDWTVLYPEIWVLSMTSIILLLGLFLSQTSRVVTYLLSQITVVGAVFLSINLLEREAYSAFHNLLYIDPLASFLKVVMCLAAFFVFFYSKRYIFEERVYRHEYFALCLFSLLGMMLLVSSRNFLSLYLSIELMILPLYALITIVRDDTTAPEAAMKYFVTGGLSSGLFLYGISFLYGVSGTFDMNVIAEILSNQTEMNTLILLGMGLVLVGLLFKFGAVPFHMWLPDVYQGSPICVTLFIGTIPKVAALGFAIRLLMDAFIGLEYYWQQVVTILGILSLSIGHVIAIAQTNLKRLLAYSTIAHVGFVLLALLTQTELGLAAALDYTVIYVVMGLGAFGIITLLSHQGFEVEEINHLRGLASRCPWVATIMMFMLFSLAGIPPFAGFFAKFFVLEALVSSGHLGLAIFSVIMTVVGAFYYLRLIRVMYFSRPNAGPNPYQSLTASNTLMLSLNGLMVLAMGFFPGPLFDVCLAVITN